MVLDPKRLYLVYYRLGSEVELRQVYASDRGAVYDGFLTWLSKQEVDGQRVTEEQLLVVAQSLHIHETLIFE